jgi:hypothetical protein
MESIRTTSSTRSPELLEERPPEISRAFEEVVMPASYLIDQPRGVVFSRAWGVLTDEEILAHAVTLRSDTRFTPGLRQVADFREPTKLAVTSDGVRRAAKNNPFGPDARRSFVAPLDETLGMLRMFGIYLNADDSQFRIFRTLGPAMEWVGLDPTTPWPVQQPDATFGGP